MRRRLPRLDALIAEGVRRSRSNPAMGSISREPRCGSCRARALGRQPTGRDPHDVSRRARAAARGRMATRNDYIDLVCRRDDPAVAQAKAWPTPSMPSWKASRSRREQIARVFARRKALGLPVKLHADQLSNLGGAALAAEVRRAVGRSSGTYGRGRRRRHGAAPASVAVLLPGAFYFIRETTRAAGRRCSAPTACRWRIATDCNPGSSPLTSLLLAHEYGARRCSG